MEEIGDPLSSYKAKRDFSLTPEPAGVIPESEAALSFVVQKHDARNLHYDFRLELHGVLKSWAVPKGPSLDPKQKRLAVNVEDHPLSYAGFEGVIPPKQYGAGTVAIWDQGTWEPIGDPDEGLAAGQLKFHLHGEKLNGAWVLIQLRPKPGERQKPWLLIKERDGYVRSQAEFDVLESMPDSVVKGEPLSVPSGAVKGPVPLTLAPQLATLVDTVPSDDNWIYEVKLDGYRILARIDEEEVSLLTRNGLNWTARMESLASALRKLKIAPGWLDGEVIWLGTDGMPDFGALQNSFESNLQAGLHYYIFDMPFFRAYDLRNIELVQRRKLLADLLKGSSSDQIHFSEDFTADGEDIKKNACLLGLEGIMGKRKNSHYMSGRSLSWIKLKCSLRQEFVLAGYTLSKGSDRAVGALLLAVHDDAGHLLYAGKVGTGFDDRTSMALKEKLAAIATDQSPLFEKPPDAAGLWVRPELVAEVSFAGWTKSDRVRHAVFRGLRTDKPADTIVRESGQTVPERTYSGPHISNPDRVIDPSSGLRKIDLINYYQLASRWMLPSLKDRPVAFLRAPSGIDGTLFFQKHAETLHIPGLTQLDPAFDPEHPPLMAIDSIEALLGAVQMNVVEFHTWNAVAKDIDRPDRMVFDLDPGEGIEWKRMLEAASITRTLLEELGLKSFLKTSGGKGLHVFVPLTPHDDWDTVRNFAKAVAMHLTDTMPDRFASVSGARNRVGRIFVDYMRNSRGATTVSAFSARARSGLGISMPCSWEELPTLKSGSHWTIATAQDRLEHFANSWEKVDGIRQIILPSSMDTLSSLHKQ